MRSNAVAAEAASTRRRPDDRVPALRAGADLRRRPRGGAVPAIDNSEQPGALRASAAVECRCGATAVDVQQRGDLLIVIPRPGRELIGSAGTDQSVIL
jgi:hypothetical protein